jgi:energy-coupling factor transporter ATP-binding protein EcfA2
MIAIDALTYTYPGAAIPALNNVSLSIQKGELVALVGANGAGKSSLCYTAAGLIPHFYRGDMQGSVQVAGMETTNTPLNRMAEKVGLVLQNPLNQISGARDTVAAEIAFGLENLGVPRAEMRSRVDAILTRLGIQNLASKSPFALSGGQQQKVVIASILVMQPEILVLDEPCAQLDSSSAQEIFQLLQSLALAGSTVLIAEHRVEWVAAYASRVIALSNGRILADGPPAEVLTSPMLVDQGILLPQVTRLARRALAEKLWPERLPLPIHIEEAASGFRGDMRED